MVFDIKYSIYDIIVVNIMTLTASKTVETARPSVAGLSRLGSGIFVKSDILFVCCLFRGSCRPDRPGPTNGPELLRATDQTESQGLVPRDWRGRTTPAAGAGDKKEHIGCRRTPRRLAVEQRVRRAAQRRRLPRIRHSV